MPVKGFSIFSVKHFFRFPLLKKHGKRRFDFGKACYPRRQQTFRWSWNKRCKKCRCSNYPRNTSRSGCLPSWKYPQHQWCILYDKNGNEVKEWYALASYLKSFGNDGVPNWYAAPDGRKDVSHSWNPIQLLKNPNWITLVVLGAVLIAVLVVVLIVRAVSNRLFGRRGGSRRAGRYRG